MTITIRRQILAASSVAILFATSTAQGYQADRSYAPDAFANGPSLIQKIASSCRSKCQQQQKSCKSKCPKGSSWAQDCRMSCNATYNACVSGC
jgi:hypothetical protein